MTEKTMPVTAADDLARSRALRRQFLKETLPLWRALQTFITSESPAITSGPAVTPDASAADVRAKIERARRQLADTDAMLAGQGLRLR